MHIKKGNVLVITSLFTALTSLVVLAFISICINDLKMNNINIYTANIYTMDNDDEKTISNFMKVLNDMEIEKENKRLKCDDFVLNDGENTLSFIKNNNCFYADYKEEIFQQKIDYKIKDGKIILIPSYTKFFPKKDFSKN